MSSFDFTGDLSPLQQTIDLDPEVTRLALEFATQSLTPSFREQRQATKNELANLGALQSSTLTDAFAQADRDLASQQQAITAQASLADRARALQNRIGLLGTGLEATSLGTGLAGQNQQQQNQFALQNFQNQVAASLGQQQSGGFFGGLTGALGGGLAGFGLGGPIGAGIGALGGGLAGGFGAPGTGGSLLNAGSLVAAAPDVFQRIKPGSAAGRGRQLASRGRLTNQFNSSGLGVGLGGF